MNEISLSPSLEILAAMTDLWRLRALGPNDINQHPAFLRLLEECSHGRSDSTTFGFKFALSSALRSLGLPYSLHKNAAHLALPVNEAAQALVDALSATEIRLVHLAPLDLADELPELSFGAAKLCRLSPNELRELFDEPRIKRLYPRQVFDAERFSEFHWLIVEETVALDPKVGARALPFLSFDFSQDLGRIEPHKGRFPRVFEDALFFLLLGKWEEWSAMAEVDWRGFRVPWVYTANRDLFVRPNVLPSPDTLSWEPHIYDDGYGDTVEVERPVVFRLDEASLVGLTSLDQSCWEIVERARQSILFETPIAHFFVRAFLVDGVDEFLAHITMIEAALGLQSDYQKSVRVAPDRHNRMRATTKVRGRIAGLLGDVRFAEQYERLFNVRSAYLHGRAMTTISTQEQVIARSLARRIVEALISATRTASASSREDFLDDLLDRGALSASRFPASGSGRTAPTASGCAPAPY
ncbi:hypothetical protein [Pseudotabrizicola sediminis]|uniref:hypothetical protein n=1 Tax=Pseudotabrizicola sediminis TaxID=2486418 RepID=UPI001AEC4709|nr:hypothetical protein [Pseudotabrizicola sediminis]